MLNHDTDARVLLDVAREALTARLDGIPYRPEPLPPPLDASRGVFVTLRKHGRLRGCIGHVMPVYDSLATEVASCSVSAGLRDSRFPAVQAEELGEIDFEVSVLTVPEPTSLEALDPRRYGVIVHWQGRYGVLLPDLDGVDTPEHQIAICRQKAGIPEGVPVELERFEVVKVTP